MIDVKGLRDHRGEFDLSLKKRGISGVSAASILALDEERRVLLAKAEAIRAERNKLAREIGEKKAQKQECADILALADEKKTTEEAAQEESDKAAAALEEILVSLPNILLESIPEGTEEADDLEVGVWGIPKTYPWMKGHIAIGQALGGIDVEQAVLVAGSRFFYLRGDVARLERALGQWMIDLHTREGGFTEIATPYLVRAEALFGAGQLPKFEEDAFKTTDGRYLISTSEVTLINWVREKILSITELPMRLTALTPCFRSEVGAAGRDTQGIMRVHHFNKVELVSICTPETSWDEHEMIRARAERVLKLLELPYRVVILCAGNTGFCSRKTYDLEVWIPGEKRYREISSCSNCTDFQSRRLKTRYRRADGSIEHVHMLNGSGVAVTRALIAVLENYQQEDGSVVIPEVLVPYMGGQKRICAERKT